eukprot:CAMPEP_0181509702 /NCGR_PEP_ID=MMETSP1110-20121109/60485_1 /TAXON_ID=174948 /ORGANISM="Symbiodinium sp., Strain CCMP421" /LENGTH=160 /DNA_ID=CAMNT_0023639277 /DNA_START=29 /DNA_END=509 /DNA_ORIENTATION=+
MKHSLHHEGTQQPGMPLRRPVTLSSYETSVASSCRYVNIAGKTGICEATPVSAPWSRDPQWSSRATTFMLPSRANSNSSANLGKMSLDSIAFKSSSLYVKAQSTSSSSAAAASPERACIAACLEVINGASCVPASTGSPVEEQPSCSQSAFSTSLLTDLV